MAKLPKKTTKKSSLPYSGAAAAKKNPSFSTKSAKQTAATTAKKPPTSQQTLHAKPKRHQQSSMKSLTWGKTRIIEWMIDNPVNEMVLNFSDSGAGAQINIHELKERRKAATTTEGQAALIAKSGDYSKAAQMQEHAEQLKERFCPEIDLYYDVMEAAS